MKNNSIILIITISVIAILVAGFTIPSFIKMPHHEASENPEQPQNTGNMEPPIKEENIQIKTLISFINLGLIIPLFIIYAGIYRKIKSSFTLGLIAVIISLGMYAVTSNPIIVTLLGGIPGYVGIFQIIPDLCATAALLILIRISLE
ncbi:hypothetical protein [Methanoplanus limicola]|uniref:Uncharacterized protein n=1 Tax=Methanoplanus limicola DSM 2279 TaxID=937775 RepID=H1Z2T7_9EURY|nr:hypothetical protein [Methanoplanus limicola]EHQ34676.1 hypothetical protein Metlim_0541 [Methanoplanus limicola DSM 2279]